MRLTGAISMNFQLRKMRVNIRSHILFFHLIHSFLDIFPIYILEKIRRTMVSSLLAVNRTQFLFHSRYRIYVRLSIGEKSHTNQNSLRHDGIKIEHTLCITCARTHLWHATCFTPPLPRFIDTLINIVEKLRRGQPPKEGFFFFFFVINK